MRAAAPEYLALLSKRKYLMLIFIFMTGINLLYPLQKLNLAKNGITDFRTEQSLLMFPFTDKRFDLIVSNLPAKAGKEVLSDFIKEAPFYLTGRWDCCSSHCKTALFVC